VDNDENDIDEDLSRLQLVLQKAKQMRLSNEQVRISFFSKGNYTHCSLQMKPTADIIQTESKCVRVPSKSKVEKTSRVYFLDKVVRSHN
jgi:hypothetical protein